MPRKNIGSVLAGSWLSIARYVCLWHIASLRCCATISRLSGHSGPRKPSARQIYGFSAQLRDCVTSTARRCGVASKALRRVSGATLAHRSQIVLSVLKIVLRSDPVAAQCFGVGQRQIPLVVSLCVLRRHRARMSRPRGFGVLELRSSQPRVGCAFWMRLFRRWFGF